jgi:hypothetical protein
MGTSNYFLGVEVRPSAGATHRTKAILAHSRPTQHKPSVPGVFVATNFETRQTLAGALVAASLVVMSSNRGRFALARSKAEVAMEEFEIFSPRVQPHHA